MSAEVKQATSVIGNLSLSDVSSWDEHYDNPKAEIILVSNDKIGFRVDAWQFKKESAFIRDLITFPSDQSLESTPIELDHTSKIARYFIDFVMSGSTSTAQISMKEFEELFQLSDKFVTEKVDQALLVAIELRVQHLLASKRADPWAIFRLATARDHPELARAIIRAFECDFPTLASASSMSRSSTASLAATLEPSCLLDTIPDTLTTTTITP